MPCCCDSALCRLHNLINSSLHRYTEPSVLSSTAKEKEKEKDVLISLSQVMGEIQNWIRLVDFDSVQKCCSGLELERQEHYCLIMILSDLMFLLTMESQYIQHLVGNVLVAISEFLVVSENGWDSFLHLLFSCLELAIANMLCPWEPSRTGAEDSNCDLANFVVLRSRLKSANWSTAAGIVRVLRNILKHLKQECDDDDDDDDRLIRVYLGSVSSFLSNGPWDFMNEVHTDQCRDAKDSARNCNLEDALVLKGLNEKEPKVVFLGNLIQFLSSLVEQCSGVEAEVYSQEQHPVLCIIISLVPKLVHWCLIKKGNSVNLFVSQYLRHKLLMLMLRLSYQIYLGCSTLLSWLQLLHDYFKELLDKPITKVESGQGACLEDSPFLLSLSDAKVLGMDSLHLQRQTVLLFLRCCFSLISLTGESTNQCARSGATLRSSMSFDCVSDLDCCSRKKGFLELYLWLQRNLPTDMFVDREMYMGKCLDFSKSFLKLYMHEDDLLFKVLLQLLSVPSCSEQQLHGDKWTFQNMKDVVFHASNLFNPVFLFHLFLAELHYDHQVLLDYLISKDTGISCAEYLLRCLRAVCKSWNLFVTFSVDGKVMNQSCCKKRRILLDISDLQDQSSPIPVVRFSPSLDEECKGDFHFLCEHHKNKNEREPFEGAKHCLLSLKDSVENLLQKNLFPYNPEVLLKRLTQFQQLCFN